MSSRAERSTGALPVDPVCGMTVDPADAAGSFEYRGHTYYFCNPRCRARFVEDPKRYLAPEPEEAPASPGQVYVCPMDPEVESDRPGSCPKCGMALEPMVDDLSTAEIDTPNPELVDMTRRFWIALVLATPVFLLTMGDMATGGALMHRLGTTRVNWVELVLATPGMRMRSAGSSCFRNTAHSWAWRGFAASMSSPWALARSTMGSRRSSGTSWWWGPS